MRLATSRLGEGCLHRSHAGLERGHLVLHLLIALFEMLDVFRGLCHDCSLVQLVCRCKSLEILAFLSITAHSAQCRDTLPQLNDLVVEIVAIPLLNDVVRSLLHRRLVAVLRVAILVLGLLVDLCFPLATSSLFWRIGRRLRRKARALACR